MFKAKSVGVSQAKQQPNRDPAGAVLVRHPALPGKDMMPAKPDYAEIPFGSISKHSQNGGINGGLGPFQSEQGAESGEYQG
jgi:hypothetical protein